MKFGVRIPSIKKRISARISLKRMARHRLGLKMPRGAGFVTDPKRFFYNKIYNKTSVGVDRLLLGKRSSNHFNVVLFLLSAIKSFFNKSNKFEGVIIEESLENKDILKRIKILKTKIEPVVEKHKTPWLNQWTLHAVEIDGSNADIVADEISKALESEHSWYADFKNNKTHYIIFKDKVFKIIRTSKEQYDKAKEYGISLGIPPYQVDFHPEVKEWKR